MNLEQQVSSLELSKTLKNLGVRQESAFYWFRMNEYFVWKLIQMPEQPEPGDYFSAFTVAELYKIHCDLDPHACYRFPEGIEPEHLADHLAEEICQLLKK